MPSPDSGNAIQDVDASIPAGDDNRRFGDEEIRLCKRIAQSDFINFLPSTSQNYTPVLVSQPDINTIPFKVDERGDTMQGPLYGFQVNPTADLEFVTRKWVLDLWAGLVPGSGSDYPFGITELFKSPESPIVPNDDSIYTHNLSRKPDEIHLRLRCISADAGYAVGDVIPINGAQSDDSAAGGDTGGIQAWDNDTLIGWTMGKKVWAPFKGVGNGQLTALTPASWLGTITGFLIE